MGLILDQKLVDEVVTSVKKTFQSVFNIEVVPGEPIVKRDSTAKGDISGIVGMVQEKIEGTMCVFFEKELIFNLLGTMYGKQFKDVDPAVQEGAGEITNIIYGLVKSSLNARGHAFKMALPNVIFGQDSSVINIHQKGSSLVIPFETPTGRFYVQLTQQSST